MLFTLWQKSQRPRWYVDCENFGMIGSCPYSARHVRRFASRPQSLQTFSMVRLIGCTVLYCLMDKIFHAIAARMQPLQSAPDKVRCKVGCSGFFRIFSYYRAIVNRNQLPFRKSVQGLPPCSWMISHATRIFVSGSSRLPDPARHC